MKPKYHAQKIAIWAIKAQALLVRLIEWEAGMPDGTKMTGYRKDSFDRIIIEAKKLTEEQT